MIEKYKPSKEVVNKFLKKIEERTIKNQSLRTLNYKHEQRL